MCKSSNSISFDSYCFPLCGWGCLLQFLKSFQTRKHIPQLRIRFNHHSITSPFLLTSTQIFLLISLVLIHFSLQIKYHLEYSYYYIILFPIPAKEYWKYFQFGFTVRPKSKSHLRMKIWKIAVHSMYYEEMFLGMACSTMNQPFRYTNHEIVNGFHCIVHH